MITKDNKKAWVRIIDYSITDDELIECKFKEMTV